VKFDSDLTETSATLPWQIVCKEFPFTNVEDIDKEGYAIQQSVSQICLKPECYVKSISNNSKDDMVHFTILSYTSLATR
jgi:hypothetical protein